MNRPCIHVVGAGIAGLSAGLAATRQGESVVLYEAASQAGGRCRTLEGPGGITHDNGTHVLFTGNRAATALLTEIGARAIGSNRSRTAVRFTTREADASLVSACRRGHGSARSCAPTGSLPVI